MLLSAKVTPVNEIPTLQRGGLGEGGELEVRGIRGEACPPRVGGNDVVGGYASLKGIVDGSAVTKECVNMYVVGKRIVDGSVSENTYEGEVSGFEKGERENYIHEKGAGESIVVEGLIDEDKVDKVYSESVCIGGADVESIDIVEFSVKVDCEEGVDVRKCSVRVDGIEGVDVAECDLTVDTGSLNNTRNEDVGVVYEVVKGESAVVTMVTIENESSANGDVKNELEVGSYTNEIRIVGDGVGEDTRVEDGVGEDERVGDGVGENKRVGDGVGDDKRVGDGVGEDKRVGDGVGEDKRVGDGVGEDKRVGYGVGKDKRVGDGVDEDKIVGYVVGEDKRLGDGVDEDKRVGYGVGEYKRVDSGIAEDVRVGDGVDEDKIVGDGVGEDKRVGDGDGENKRMDGGIAEDIRVGDEVAKYIRVGDGVGEDKRVEDGVVEDVRVEDGAGEDIIVGDGVGEDKRVEDGVAEDIRVVKIAVEDIRVGNGEDNDKRVGYGVAKDIRVEDGVEAGVDKILRNGVGYDKIVGDGAGGDKRVGDGAGGDKRVINEVREDKSMASGVSAEKLTSGYATVGGYDIDDDYLKKVIQRYMDDSSSSPHAVTRSPESPPRGHEVSEYARSSKRDFLSRHHDKEYGGYAYSRGSTGNGVNDELTSGVLGYVARRKHADSSGEEDCDIEPYYSDSEFLPQRSNLTEDNVKSKTHSAREVVKRQTTVLAKLKECVSSFDDINSEIRKIKQDYMEEQFRRSMLSYDTSSDEESDGDGYLNTTPIYGNSNLSSYGDGRLETAKFSHEKYNSYNEDESTTKTVNYRHRYSNGQDEYVPPANAGRYGSSYSEDGCSSPTAGYRSKYGHDFDRDADDAPPEQKSTPYQPYQPYQAYQAYQPLTSRDYSVDRYATPAPYETYSRRTADAPDYGIQRRHGYATSSRGYGNAISSNQYKPRKSFSNEDDTPARYTPQRRSVYNINNDSSLSCDIPSSTRRQQYAPSHSTGYNDEDEVFPTGSRHRNDDRTLYRTSTIPNTFSSRFLTKVRERKLSTDETGLGTNNNNNVNNNNNTVAHSGGVFKSRFLNRSHGDSAYGSQSSPNTSPQRHLSPGNVTSGNTVPFTGESRQSSQADANELCPNASLYATVSN